MGQGAREKLTEKQITISKSVALKALELAEGWLKARFLCVF